MQLKIGKKTFELSAFIKQESPTFINYLIRMPLAETDINLIKSAKEFSVVNGDSETFYTAECVQYRVYSEPTSEMKDLGNGEFELSATYTDTIEYTFYEEIGARVNDLLNRIAELEQSQSDQDDIIMDILMSEESEV